jgi:hypothetical protein
MNKKKLKNFIIIFLVIFAFQIFYKKFITSDGPLTPSPAKPLNWEDIYHNIPIYAILSALGSIILTLIIINNDKK